MSRLTLWALLHYRCQIWPEIQFITLPQGCFSRPLSCFKAIGAVFSPNAVSPPRAAHSTCVSFPGVFLRSVTPELLLGGKDTVLKSQSPLPRPSSAREEFWMSPSSLLRSLDRSELVTSLQDWQDSHLGPAWMDQLKRFSISTPSVVCPAPAERLTVPECSSAPASVLGRSGKT